MNSVSLVGRATRDPEMRYQESGKVITNIGIAIQRGKDVADFFDVTAFDKTAEVLGEYVRKGSRFGIEGRLQLDTWEKDGQKRSKVIVIAQRVHLLDGKRDDGDKELRSAAKELGGRVIGDDDVNF